MYDLKSLETATLIELLAEHTAKYTSKIAEKGSGLLELSQYEYEIALMQSELNSRKTMAVNTLAIPTQQKE